jgi:hypothetical protein
VIARAIERDPSRDRRIDYGLDAIDDRSLHGASRRRRITMTSGRIDREVIVIDSKSS